MLQTSDSVRVGDTSVFHAAMKKERPPYLSMNTRGEFYNFKAERVIPTLKAVMCWGWHYFGRLPFRKLSRTFLALLCTSVSHSVHDSPTGSR